MVTRLAGEDLVYHYPGPVAAVQGVDVEALAGELICILGPNGSGKSTLLRLLAGLLSPQRGRVQLDGAPLRGLHGRARAKGIALVPQGLRALPEVTAHDFVLGGRYAHLGPWRRPSGSDEEAVRRALTEADVGELESRLLSQVSGGQFQRLLVARALAQESEVLLVDEPTSSLDPEHQLGVFRLLSQQAASGRAVVVVTHDLNLASQMARRLVVLREGRVHAEGTPEEVLVPEVLHPVYGPELSFGSLPVAGGGQRPFVLPWPGPG